MIFCLIILFLLYVRRVEFCLRRKGMGLGVVVLFGMVGSVGDSHFLKKGEIKSSEMQKNGEFIIIERHRRGKIELFRNLSTIIWYKLNIKIDLTRNHSYP